MKVKKDLSFFFIFLVDWDLMGFMSNFENKMSIL